MGSDFVIGILKHCLATGATVMAPILLVGLLVGISVGALQAATQVNEPTLTFVPKVLAVGLLSSLLMPWGIAQFVGIVHAVMNGVAQAVVH